MKNLIILLLLSSFLALQAEENYRYSFGNVTTNLIVTKTCCKPIIQIKKVSDDIIPIVADTVTPIANKWRQYDLPDVWGTSLWKDTYWEAPVPWSKRLATQSVNDSTISFQIFSDTSDHPQFLSFTYGSTTSRFIIKGMNLQFEIKETNGVFSITNSPTYSIVEQTFDLSTGKVFLRFNKKFTDIYNVPIVFQYQVQFKRRIYRENVKIIPLTSIESGYYCVMLNRGSYIEKHMIYITAGLNFIINAE